MPCVSGAIVGLPIFTDYGASLAFVGKLHTVMLGVNGELIEDDEMIGRKTIVRQQIE